MSKPVTALLNIPSMSVEALPWTVREDMLMCFSRLRDLADWQLGEFPSTVAELAVKVFEMLQQLQGLPEPGPGQVYRAVQPLPTAVAQESRSASLGEEYNDDSFSPYEEVTFTPHAYAQAAAQSQAANTTEPTVATIASGVVSVATVNSNAMTDVDTVATVVPALSASQVTTLVQDPHSAVVSQSTSLASKVTHPRPESSTSTQGPSGSTDTTNSSSVSTAAVAGTGKKRSLAHMISNYRYDEDPPSSSTAPDVKTKELNAIRTLAAEITGGSVRKRHKPATETTVRLAPVAVASSTAARPVIQASSRSSNQNRKTQMIDNLGLLVDWFKNGWLSPDEFTKAKANLLA
jgi:hypothetical protein